MPGVDARQRGRVVFPQHLLPPLQRSSIHLLCSFTPLLRSLGLTLVTSLPCQFVDARQCVRVVSPHHSLSPLQRSSIHLLCRFILDQSLSQNSTNPLTCSSTFSFLSISAP